MGGGEEPPEPRPQRVAPGDNDRVGVADIARVGRIGRQERVEVAAIVGVELLLYDALGR